VPSTRQGFSRDVLDLARIRVGATVAEGIDQRKRRAAEHATSEPYSLHESDRVMNAKYLVPALSLIIPALAHAEPESLDATSSFDHRVAPVKNALELGVATGYSQGGGKLGGNMGNLEDISGPGAAFELDAGYRIIPQLSIGAYGTFAQNQRGDALDTNAKVYGATAGVQAAWHFRPEMSIDPWVSLGTGWRGLWVDSQSAKNTSLQGLELARLQIGADYRVSEDVAIAPVIGGSLSMFVSQDSPMTTDYTEIKDKKVSFTGFAGLSGRFDLGGTR
jgi:outer membrane protein W